jgi:hypothetical protein
MVDQAVGVAGAALGVSGVATGSLAWASFCCSWRAIKSQPPKKLSTPSAVNVTLTPAVNLGWVLFGFTFGGGVVIIWAFL